ncbi:MAG: hypothetical protein ACOX1P_16840 [Thermoguttaceae bacterium]|jgi:hypothetical protein
MSAGPPRVAVAIQDWKQLVRDQIDDIGAHRRVDPEDRVWWPLRDPPRNFYTATERLLLWMAQHHPGVDVSPIHRVYQAIQAVHNGAGVDDLLPQGALEAIADSAAMVLNVALGGILEENAGVKAAEPPNPGAKITVDIACGTITVDGEEYAAEPHQCTAIKALLAEGGRNMTGPELSGLHGCAGKNWTREFRRLKEAIPPLADRILSDNRKGYRLVDA